MSTFLVILHIQVRAGSLNHVPAGHLQDCGRTRGYELLEAYRDLGGVLITAHF